MLKKLTVIKYGIGSRRLMRRKAIVAGWSGRWQPCSAVTGFQITVRQQAVARLARREARAGFLSSEIMELRIKYCV